MADRNRKLLRPEDATSWEEFQARSVIEQAQCRGSTGSWKDIGRIVISAVPGFGALIFWIGVGTAHDAGRWFLLILALICTGLFSWGFGGVMRKGWRGSRRYMELDRLRKEWQAKAERGEIPQTTTGGPKVWQDEVEAETQGT
ncbi:MAG TPA: hypothetical protein VE733_19965 [Streptosporangiaceae bacterium]|jgi:hypothetical protein|nr:hypothetical protein [Streptosporangiaceae bacterium]